VHRGAGLVIFAHSFWARVAWKETMARRQPGARWTNKGDMNVQIDARIERANEHLSTERAGSRSTAAAVTRPTDSGGAVLLRAAEPGSPMWLLSSQALLFHVQV
jgi:hypothetical protein